MSTEQTPVKDSLTTESTTFDRELAKIGKVVLLQYTVESGNGPYTQSNLAIVRETNDANKFSALIVDDEDIDGPLAGYAYLNPPHDEDFTIVRMATPKESEAAGVEYIERPVSAEELAELRKDSERLYFILARCEVVFNGAGFETLSQLDAAMKGGE